MSLQYQQSLPKSSIFTRYTRKSSSSLPSISIKLPKRQVRMQTQRKSLPLIVKSNHELSRERRSKDLELLRKQLEEEYEQEKMKKQQVKDKVQSMDEESFVNSIDKKLQLAVIEASKSPLVKKEQNEDDDNFDVDRQEFMSSIQHLVHLQNIVFRQNNIRLRAKAYSLLQIFKSKSSLLSLLTSIPSTPLPNLYTSFHPLWHNNLRFHLQLKRFNTQIGYIVNSYENSKYDRLNNDIARIKIKMSGEMEPIGRKLRGIDDGKIRAEVVRTVKSMDLECIANREYYCQLSQRLKKIQL